jgi:hypothetical protein
MVHWHKTRTLERHKGAAPADHISDSCSWIGTKSRIGIHQAMTKRLQLILSDDEYQEVLHAARLRKISIAEWIRQALGIFRSSPPRRSVAQKIEAVRLAARFEFPTADIDAMLDEIEKGYQSKNKP